MISRVFFRWGWFMAVLGGTFYLALNGLIEIVFADHWAGSGTSFLNLSYTDYSRFLWVPAVLLLGGFIQVARQHTELQGQLGRVGFFITAIGFILDILGNLIEFWVCGILLVPFQGSFRTGGECSNFGYSFSGFGTIFLMVGLFLFGMAAIRSDLPTKWRIVLFTTGLVYATILPIFLVDPRFLIVHAIAFGTSWVFIGYFMKE